MKKVQPISVTLEEAVARLVNLDYIPTGFSLGDMSDAFLEDAEVAYHNAKVDKLSIKELMPYAIRVDICRARLDLASSLLDHMKLELEHPETSLLKESPDSVNYVRLELKSVANWAEEHFGISVPDWSGDVAVEAHPNEQFDWKDVTIKIYKDYKIGCFVGKDLRITSHFRKIGLMGAAKNIPNHQGIILIGMSQGQQIPRASSPKANEKTSVAKIRSALKKLTGISKDPFYPINESDGWRPKFTLEDDQKNADLRAKKRAVNLEYDDKKFYSAAVSDYEEAEEHNTRPFDNENDDTSQWLRDNN